MAVTCHCQHICDVSGSSASCCKKSLSMSLITSAVQDAVKVAQHFMESNGSIQFNLIALCAGPPAE